MNGINKYSFLDGNYFIVFFVFLLGFALPVSTALTNILVPVVGFIGLYLSTKSNKLLIIKQPIVWLSLLLFVFLSIGVLYSTSPSALDVLSKYRKLIFLPLIVMCFLYNARLVTFTLFGFLIGNACILILSTLVWGTGINDWLGFVLRPASSISKNAIAQSLLMAIASFMALTLSTQTIKWRKLLIVFAAIGILNVIVMSPQRIGYLAILIFSIVYGYNAFSAKIRILFFSLFALVLVGIWQVPNRVTDRVKLGVDEIAQCVNVVYQPALRDKACISSMGLRTYFYATAVNRMMEHPFFGRGTGNLGIAPLGGQTGENPHNEYLMQGVQIGFLGVFLYAGLLIVALFKSQNLNGPWSTFMIATILVYMFGSLLNSFLLDISEGNTLIVLLAALLSLVVIKDNKIDCNEIGLRST